MVSKPLFVDAFWHCYNTLQAAATPEVGMPGYFRFLTLLGGLGFTRDGLQPSRQTPSHCR
jgi:hypothetical protein